MFIWWSWVDHKKMQLARDLPANKFAQITQHLGRFPRSPQKKRQQQLVKELAQVELTFPNPSHC